ncbi:YchJ family protein [Pseudomonas sp. TTU2014-080ASC]|uniref:YchJ family protein n=1 Tax=Pseudomonas sp. TTU2014-080ASC TaxID=1729724 RepID=UPI000718856B|nr:YchJ family protein [Pseudomonas sp. TTU2014-080ASC]KRW61990.1 hypothetical protein AO726_00750 [Pseudomonas sp. TTU2014-080ASC]
MNNSTCPCGSQLTLNTCCGRYHAGTAAPTAEALMRSRYSAYTLGLVDYLVTTTLPAQQSGLDREAIQNWSLGSTWLGLEVEDTALIEGAPAHAWVTFTAQWQDISGKQSHRERSAFVEHQGRWYFIDPTVDLKPGRNDPCPCSSGQKFKKCCSAFF